MNSLYLHIEILKWLPATNTSKRNRLLTFDKRWSLSLKLHCQVRLHIAYFHMQLASPFKIFLAHLRFRGSQKRFGSGSLRTPCSVSIARIEYLIFGGLLFQKKHWKIFLSRQKKFSSGFGSELKRNTNFEIADSFKITVFRLWWATSTSEKPTVPKPHQITEDN